MIIALNKRALISAARQPILLAGVLLGFLIAQFPGTAFSQNPNCSVYDGPGPRVISPSIAQVNDGDIVVYGSYRPLYPHFYMGGVGTWTIENGTILSSWTVEHPIWGPSSYDSVRVVWNYGTGSNPQLGKLRYRIDYPSSYSCYVDGETTTQIQLQTGPSPLSLSVNATQPPCNFNNEHNGQPGPHTGTADAVASGGTAPYTYYWSNASTSSNLGNEFVGTYTVTVTDQDGATVAGTASLTEPGYFEVGHFQDFNNKPCPEGGGGVAQAAALQGGVSPIVYSGAGWTGPANTNDFQWGTNTLVAIDANGCKAEEVINYFGTWDFFLDAPTFTGGHHISCAGANDGSITAYTDQGPPPHTFSWSGPNGFTGNSQNISGLGPGTYTVTVTDGNGCTGQTTGSTGTSKTLTAPSAIQLSASATANNGGCDGTVSAIASGGAGGFSFLWSNGSTSAILSGLCGGSYSVTVTDASGCSQVESVTVSGISAFSVTITKTDVPCNAANDHLGQSGPHEGTATVTVSGGTAPYTYSWSNGSTFANSGSVFAGTYTVTITDQNGGSVVEVVTLAEPAVFSVGHNVLQEPCPTMGYGVAEAFVVSGGALPVQYSGAGWGMAGAVNNSFPWGTNTMYAVDANGCEAEDDIQQLNTWTYNFVPSTYPNGYNVSCGGAADGSLTVNVVGGTPPYSHLWIGPNGFESYDETITGLVAGTYTTYLVDNFGCSGDILNSPSTTFVLTEPVIELDFSSTPDLVGCNGTATVLATGGAGGYSYLWNTGSPLANAVGFCGGFQTVTVTDSDGCTSVGGVTVGSPNLGAGTTCDLQAPEFEWGFGTETFAERVIDMEVDNFGNSYVLINYPVYPINNGVPASVPNDWRPSLVKYSPSGDLIWLKRFDKMAGLAIDIHEDGYLVVVGEMFDASIDIDLGPAIHMINGANYAVVLAKYTLDAKLEWGFALPGAVSQVSFDVAFGPNHEVFISGLSSASSVDLDPDPASTFIVSRPAGSSSNFAIMAKYSTSGDFEWGLGNSNETGSQNYYFTRGPKIAVDANGYAVIAGNGSPYNEPGFPISNGSNINSATYVLRVSPTGQVVWRNNFEQISTGAVGDVVVDQAGYIYFVGMFGGNGDALDLDVGIGNNPLVVDYYTHYHGDLSPWGAGGASYLVKLNSAGAVQWGFNVIEPIDPNSNKNSHLGTSLELVDDKIFLSGHYSGEVDMDPDPVNQYLLTNSDLGSNSVSYDAFLAGYDLATGALIQAHTVVSGTGSQFGISVASDASCNIYVLGEGRGVMDLNLDPLEDVLVGTEFSYFASLVKLSIGADTTASCTLSCTSVAVDASIGCNGSLQVTVSGGVPPYTYQWSNDSTLDSNAQGNLCAATYFFTVTDANGCSKIDSVVVVSSPGPSSVSCDAQATSLEWGFSMGSANDDAIADMTADDQGNLYVVGKLSGGIDFDPSVINYVETPISTNSHFLAKYSAAGNLDWVKVLDAAITSIDVRGSELVITGEFVGTVDFDLTSGVTNLVGINNSVFVAKYSTQMDLLWTYTVFGGNAWGGSMTLDDFAGEVVFDSSGDIVFSGRAQLSPPINVIDLDAGSGTYLLDHISCVGCPNGSEYAYVVKLSNAGSFLWAEDHKGDSYHYMPAAAQLAADAQGNIIAGLRGKPLDPVLTGIFMDQFFITRYSSTGILDWTKNISGADFPERFTDLEVDAVGNIYALLALRRGVDVDPGPGVQEVGSFASGGLGYPHASAVIKYDGNNGNYLWGNSALLPAVIQAWPVEYHMASDIEVVGGSVFVTGEYWRNVDADPDPIQQSLLNNSNTTATVSLMTSEAFLLAFDEIDGGLNYVGDVKGLNDQNGLALAHDGNCNLFWGGHYDATVNLDPGGSQTVSATSVGGADLFVSKFGMDTLVGPSPCTLACTVTSMATTGPCDGFLQVAMSGGTAPYTYQWSNSGTFTGTSQSNLCAGTYTVTTTDANGCTKVISATVSGGPLGVTFGGANAGCSNAGGVLSIVASGGVPPYAYSWSTGASTSSVSGLSPGLYTVTVMDDATGISIESAIIQGNSSISIATSSTNESCAFNDGSASAAGATSYLWNTGATTASISGLTSGTYTVTSMVGVCISTDMVNVAQDANCVPPTQLVSNDCNSTINNLGQTLNCIAVTGADDYMYEITGGGLNETYARDSGLTDFQLSWVQDVQLGGIYNVRVRAKVGGVWGGYDAMCTVTTVLPRFGFTEDIVSTEIQLYPNPNEGQFNVGINSPITGRLEIALVTLTGKTVYREKVEEYSGAYFKPLSLEGHPAGVYFLRITLGDEIHHRKVVVK